MKCLTPVIQPSPNPSLSRHYRRTNAHLAETAAALGPFACMDLPLRVALSHVLEAPDGYSVPAHKHGFLELTFITRGHVDYATGTESVPVPAGSLYVMLPGIPHGWISRGAGSILFGFMLEPAASANRAALHALDDAVRRSRHRLAVAPQTGRARDLLLAEAAATSVQPALAAPLMQALLAMAIRQFLGASEDGSGRVSAAARRHALFNKARTYIDANCEHTLYVDEVAEFVGIGRRQLNRIFLDQDGRSVTVYLLERRMERARALLAEGRSAKETAYACGFRDPAYFSRFFKRYTGASPSKFAE